MTNTLTPADYQSIHDFLEGQAGIRLGAGKEYLVTSRLGRLLPMFELAGYAATGGRAWRGRAPVGCRPRWSMR